MPNRTIYFYDDVLEYLKTVPEMSKYLNGLVRMDMGGGAYFETKPERVGVPPKSTPKVEKVEKDIVMMEIPLKPGKTDYDPYICVTCGHVKVSGRCINKDCKKRGKI